MPLRLHQFSAFSNEKTLLVALLVASTQLGHAQRIAAGTGLLTGSVGYQVNTSEYTNFGPFGTGTTPSTTTVKAGTFKLDLAVGGFLADNLLLGLQLQHAVTGGSYKSTNNSTSAGPASTATLPGERMVQYYKMLTEQFGLTTTGGAGYESNLISRQSLQYINGYPNCYHSALKATGYYGAITPGIVFFQLPKFCLTATMGSLSYNRLKVKANDEVASSFDAGFGLS